MKLPQIEYGSTRYIKTDLGFVFTEDIDRWIRGNRLRAMRKYKKERKKKNRTEK